MDAGTIVLAVVAAFAPALGWVWFFYHRDRYHREPRRLIIILFALGVFIAIPVAIVVTLLVGVVILVPTVLLAGFTEEPVKWGTMAFKTRRDANLDEPVDGMIYGTTVGLGFAAGETTLYIIDGLVGDAALAAIALGADPFSQAFFVTAPLRAVATALMHGFASGIAGYFFAQAILRRTSLLRSMVLPLLGVAVLHSLFNGLLPVSIITVLPIMGVIYWRLLGRALAASPHRRDELELPAALPAAAPTSPVAPVERRLCPHCGEDIAAIARLCRYCRRAVTPLASTAGGAAGARG